MECTYVNSKGQRKPLQVTQHLRDRLLSRYEYLAYEIADGNARLDVYDLFDALEKPFTDKNVEQMVEIVLADMKRLSVCQYSKDHKDRARRHGNSAIFRNYPFEMVIQDGTLITVEIYANGLRWLNEL